MYDALVKGSERHAATPNDLMTWINADDILTSNAIGHAFRIFSEYPEIEWLGGSTQVINEDDLIVFERDVPTPNEVIREGLCDGRHWYHLQQEGMFFKMSLWQKAKHALTGHRLAGDWRLWREFAKHATYHHL